MYWNKLVQHLLYYVLEHTNSFSGTLYNIAVWVLESMACFFLFQHCAICGKLPRLPRLVANMWHECGDLSGMQTHIHQVFSKTQVVYLYAFVMLLTLSIEFGGS